MYVCESERLPSVALIWNVKLPVAVGVPERRPLELRFKPAGSDPDEIAHVGLVPPLTENCMLYAEFACAGLRVD